jgi:hypothetical protein
VTIFCIGFGAGIGLTTGSNNIRIGDASGVSEANTIRIGAPGTQTKTIVAGTFGAVVPGGTAVVVNSDGQLGTTTSSRRFKDEIKPMGRASEAILQFQPVMFQYKRDNTNTPQFGLIAEDVAEANPELVVRDKEGNPYTVRYDAVNAMLLNEFLKEHRKVQQLEKRVEMLAAGLQKVSDQLELGTSASRIVRNR